MIYIIFKDGSKLGPLAPDNPKSEHGFYDRSIQRKAIKWAKILGGEVVNHG